MNLYFVFLILPIEGLAKLQLHYMLNILRSITKQTRQILLFSLDALGTSGSFPCLE